MLFDKVQKEHILQGIKDFEEKGMPNEYGPSSTYDLVVEGKPYPPKAIMAYANFHASGRKIESYFKGGLGTDCFKKYEELGFEVLAKNATETDISAVIKDFLAQSKTGDLKTAHYPKRYNGLQLRVSFGRGVSARIPWLCFFKPPHTVTDGVYPGILYYKDKNQLVLTYGRSETNESSLHWPNVANLDTIEKWYLDTYNEKPERYGSSHIKSVYDLNKPLNSESLKDELDQMIAEYKAIKFSIDAGGKSSRFDKLDLLNKVFNYSWIYEINIQQWNQLLDATKTVLVDIIESPEDERLAISFRNDNKKRLAIIFGQKYVGGFYLEKAKPLCRFYIDSDFDISKDSRFSKSDWEFADKKGKLIYCSPEDWQGENDTQYDRIRQSVNDVLASCGRARFKRNHLKFMYDVILDSEARQQFLDFIKLDPQQRLLEAYRQYLDITGNEQELYKWEIGKQFQSNWNLKTENFGEMLSSIKFQNLFSQQSTSFYNLARKNPEDARKYYKFIFDESISTEERIRAAKTKGKELMQRWHPKWTSAGQDERTLSVLWAFNDLKNHAPYKSSFYTKYCELIDVKPEKPGDKYQDYLDHLDLFLEEYVNKDDSLVKLHNSFLDPDKHIVDPKNRLMGQNILYRILDGFWNLEKDEEENQENVEKVVEPDYNEDTMNINLNTILYGPPGTGKTYKLQNEYFDKFTTKTSSVSKVEYFINKINDYKWWEVVGAAVLDLKQSKVADIIEHPLVKFKTSLSDAKNVRASLWGILQSHTLEECTLVNTKSRQAPFVFNKLPNSIWEFVDEGEEEAPQIVELLEEFKNFQPTADKVVKRYKFVTFHQSFSYEEFIEGIKPEIENDRGSGEIAYEIKNGLFKEMCETAQKDPNNPYAIFIDEINRGNVSAIFGELITLIEDDKRLCAENEMTLTLPYSGKSFGVPENLYIIGTMNTADRSVEALDTALRRRFSFVEMMPEPEKLSKDFHDINLQELLQTINDRVELLVDRDHTIGHSYFINLKSLDDLAVAFNDKIVPLLQEYFYGDYGKIGLVLGEGFVEELDNKKKKFSAFKYDGKSDFITPSYNLKKVDKDSVVDAVSTLLTTD